MTVFARPGSTGALMSFESRYDNFIGGEWVAPAAGQLLRQPDAGHRPAVLRGGALRRRRRRAWRSTPPTPQRTAWGKTAPAERAAILNKIADRMEANLGSLALAETWDNGKPIRETLAADIPLAVDHFRYFAGAIRAQEGAHLARSTTTPSPITSTSRWAWSARSSRGISRS